MTETTPAEINVFMDLDASQTPEKITWQNQQGGESTLQNADGVFMRMWDAKKQTTVSLDLWTKAMTVPEMNGFVFQTLTTLADAFQRATGNTTESQELKKFAHAFGKKLEVFKADSKDK